MDNILKIIYDEESPSRIYDSADSGYIFGVFTIHNSKQRSKDKFDKWKLKNIYFLFF